MATLVCFAGLPFLISLALPGRGTLVLRREVYLRFSVLMIFFSLLTAALFAPIWVVALIGLDWLPLGW